MSLEFVSQFMCVSGMPTVEGYLFLCFFGLSFTKICRLKRALERVDAGPGGKNMVYWTSLREVRSNGRFKKSPYNDSTRNR